MTRLRKVDIRNFRSIRALEWTPAPGINCLVGPGDSGKSSLLDAIDFCLGARRGIQFSDSDFHGLDTTQAIEIYATVGELDPAMLSAEKYGIFFRGFDASARTIEDEPRVGLETVLTVQLRVDADLEATWCLYSDRAAALDALRNIAWSDRVRLAPLRLSASSHRHFTWGTGSLLNRVSTERIRSSSALAEAARHARAYFASASVSTLPETLSLVQGIATETGVELTPGVQPMLDSGSVAFGAGNVSIHDGAAIPLSALGVGSSRLLISGLQRKTLDGASIVIVDEVEYGLEPHRLIRLLQSLGSAAGPTPPQQVFLSTHSPVTICELGGQHISILRRGPAGHLLTPVSCFPDVHGTVRAYPEALLARSVIVCEGATEVGLLRGLDLAYIQQGCRSIAAAGVALIDAGGVGNIYSRANGLLSLGYRVAVLRDDDRQPDPTHENHFLFHGGHLAKWQPGNNTEVELFSFLPDATVFEMVRLAADVHGQALVDAHLSSASYGSLTTTTLRAPFPQDVRQVIARAAGGRTMGWFKSISIMEQLARDVIAPAMSIASPFSHTVQSLFQWAHAPRP